MNVLTIQNLSKSFGKQKIIDTLNLSVPEGSVFGFIGKNGAGKTTTMKMVLGLLQPDNGSDSAGVAECVLPPPLQERCLPTGREPAKAECQIKCSMFYPLYFIILIILS